MVEFVWMRHEFPWLGSGFVHAVAEGDAERFLRELEARGFEVVTIEGERMLTAPDFWAEIKRAFRFPDYFGSNWDAFNDAFGDLTLAERTAVVWRRADEAASSHLRLFAEAIAVLHHVGMAVREIEGKQMEVVLTGDGDSFRTMDKPTP